MNMVDGDYVKLNGRSWVVKLKKDRKLELSICISTNGGRQQVRQRVMDMKINVQTLKEDANDLKRQQALLIDTMEKVRDTNTPTIRFSHIRFIAHIRRMIWTTTLAATSWSSETSPQSEVANCARSPC